MAGGLTKIEKFNTLTWIIHVCARLPIQTLTVERNLVNVPTQIPEYHHLSLNEDICARREHLLSFRGPQPIPCPGRTTNEAGIEFAMPCM